MIAGDLQRTPLTLLFADALGYHSAAFDRASLGDVIRRIQRSPRALLCSLDTFATLIDHHVGASGAYLGLVSVLLRQTRQISRAAYSLIAEQASEGDSSAQSEWPAHDQAHRLHHMRRKAHRVVKLVGAFRQSQRHRDRPALVVAHQ